MTDAGGEGTGPQRRVAPPRARQPLERWRRGTRRIVGLIVGSEAILVTLMAMMVCLSAFATWQASRASDGADEVEAQSRVIEAQRQVWESGLQTSLHHDLQMISRYCESLTEYNAALYGLLDNEPNAGAVIPAQLTLQTLGPLSLGGVPEGACERDGSSGRAATDRSEIARIEAVLAPRPGDATTERALDASGFHRQERWLMTAGLLFAVSLFGLIGVDVLNDRAHRPRRLSGRAVRRGQAAACAVAITGFVLGISVTVYRGDGGYVVGALVAVTLVVVWRAVSWRRRSEGRSRLDTQHSQWWAEVLGALTVVAFSATALGLSAVSVHERQHRADSEEQRGIAERLSEQGQLAAIRDLSAAAELAAGDATIAAAGLQEDFAGAAAAAERRDRRESFLGDLEQSIRAELAAGGATTPSKGCPSKIRAPDTDLRTLMTQIRDSPSVAGSHIYALQEAAIECNVVADQTAASATHWSSRGSGLTIALVFLGLSGFLLALAADPGRSAGMANWLLQTGAMGAVVGVVVAVGVPVSALRDQGGLQGSGLVSFAREVASGQTNGCDVAPFDRAIDRSTDYGPAYEGRALARACEKSAVPVPGVLTSDLKADADVDHFHTDLDLAAEEGPRTSNVVGNAGWANILSGLHGRGTPKDLLKEGVSQTREAISMLESSGGGAQALHSFRFNEALGYAALGELTRAEARYRRSVECLEPAAGCPGGGFVEPSLRANKVLWALADLELLPDSPAADRLRQIVVTPSAGRPSKVPVWPGARLDLFPQEVQVSRGSGTAPTASVIWYFRPGPGSPWGVIERASQQTLLPGDHLNHPVTTDVALPAGDYRADIYVSGGAVSSLEARRVSAPAAVRQTVPDLGVAIAVPKDWQQVSHHAGTDWTSGPPGSVGASLHRVEGVHLQGDIDEYLDETLEAWLEQSFGRAAARAPHDKDPEYFAGLDQTAVRRYRDFPLTAAIGFSPYATSVWCGGGLVMAAVGGDSSDVDTEVVDDVFKSITLDGELPHLPPVGNRFQSDHFGLRIPEGWDAAERPVGAPGNQFQARDCAKGSNLLVTTEEREGRSLAGILRDTLKEYAVESDFPNFHRLSTRGVDVKGSSDAVELTFTWTSKGTGPVRQRQIYAVRGDRVLFMTFTEAYDGVAQPDPASNVFAQSLEMRGD